MAAQWHPQRNGALTPHDVTAASDRKVWWLCPAQHAYSAAVGHRTRNHSGCPYCSGRAVLAGFNDMATTHPRLAAQWHPHLNEDLTPRQVRAGTNRKFWWVCERGHEWHALASHRASKGVGCPYCANKKVLGGVNDLTATHPQLAEEWDGQRNGALSPTQVVAGSDKVVWWRCSQGHAYDSPVSRRTGPRASGCPYCSGRRPVAGVSDLASTHPHLAMQWHPTRNSERSPQTVSRASGGSVWWQCATGHEWRELISVRTARATACPGCTGRSMLLPGVNDLASTHPHLAAQWHPTRNGDLQPSGLMAGSDARIWWRGACGHEWAAVCSSRAGTATTATTAGVGCPVCTGRQVLAGFNDLATTHPHLSAQWHPTRNGDLTAAGVVAGSGHKVWWRCEQGHEWAAVIASRTSGPGREPEEGKQQEGDRGDGEAGRRAGGRGCPICSRRQVLAGVNDLATTHPHLLPQWHPTRNGDLSPTDLTAGSGRRVWWRCEQQHEWATTAASRTGPLATGCPVCSNKSLRPGVNDLATTHPHLAAQWHPVRNGDLTPADVIAGTRRTLWWCCPLGHEWPAMASNRARLGVGCPDCAPAGFSPNAPGDLYVVTDGTVHKVGVMNVGTNRVRFW
ncbi:putative Zn-finger protein [Kineococcus radiotolerans]|uniref:Putative Zn-finger protein n=1 Tax=Kineococcus radiotolerans TaxID=131568 RepID=A0A7W4XZS7_KINRA|nr:zinc-ribbon domain-containing protein [Kineococcus radiotolerans]MBB2903574.1 putative Zn-finger protein [Kineococcus radiotolerans]